MFSWSIDPIFKISISWFGTDVMNELRHCLGGAQTIWKRKVKPVELSRSGFPHAWFQIWISIHGFASGSWVWQVFLFSFNWTTSCSYRLRLISWSWYPWQSCRVLLSCTHAWMESFGSYRKSCGPRVLFCSATVSLRPFSAVMMCSVLWILVYLIHRPTWCFFSSALWSLAPCGR